MLASECMGRKQIGEEYEIEGSMREAEKNLCWHLDKEQVLIMCLVC